uniref:MPN domain-containing protein n=1 Tax=Oryza punctata TaxID=4537 RepID=A0A0E0LGY3_ORYPU
MAAAPFLGPDSPVHNTSQTAYVSPLALLGILVHAARESPAAAMGVLLGKEVDGFSVRVVDACPLPRCAGGGAFTQAIDRWRSPCSTKPTGVVGWYRSNPGFYGRPSNHDVVFHKVFEELNPRAILHYNTYGLL